MKKLFVVLAALTIGIAAPAQADELNNMGDKEVICPLLEELTAGLDTIGDSEDLRTRDRSRFNDCGYHKRSQVIATNYLGWYKTSNSDGHSYYVRINHVVYASGVVGFRPEAIFAADEWRFSSTCTSNTRFEFGAELFGIRNHEFMAACKSPSRKA